MTINKNGGGTGASMPFDGLLGLPPKAKPMFKENLKVGNNYEAIVRYLLALQGFDCYGTTPGKHEDGTPINYPKEQRDIVVYSQSLVLPPEPWNDPYEQFTPGGLRAAAAEWQREFYKHNCFPVEVKSHKLYFTGPWDFEERTEQDFVTLDDLRPWKQKDPRPRAVVTISQKATIEELLEGKGLVVAVDEYSASSVYTARIWNGKKEVVRVPVSTCISWLEFVDWLEKIGVSRSEY
jgi:hypothetical protein